ncbi:MAG: ABC transporter permease subunit [Verrucomicrobia bacterium]|nr:ABC transporter permease subunit [Verrucomicrobiota bacterium]
MSSPYVRPPLPERFQVAKRTLAFDRFMQTFIKLGGGGIIVAVLLIFVFIALQVIPLFRGARVDFVKSVPVALDEVVLMGADDWGELPFFVDASGSIFFKDLPGLSQPDGGRGIFQVGNPLPAGFVPSVMRFNENQKQILFGSDDGRFTIVPLQYRTVFPPEGGRRVEVSLESFPVLPIGQPGYPVLDLAYGDSGTNKMAAAVQVVDGSPRLFVQTLFQRRTLLGLGPLTIERSYDLTPLLSAKPVQVLIPFEANAVVALSESGEVSYFFYQNGEFYLRQSFTPFAGLEDTAVASMDYILGDVSLMFTHASGVMRVWSLYRSEATDSRIFGEAKRFPDLPAGADFYSASLRNKGFLAGTGSLASLRYMTTEVVRWEQQLPFTIVQARIAPRYNALFFLDDTSQLHIYDLRDPHPMAGWRTFFGRIRYEGQAHASFEWQSTGGRDDFERKLSLVPLIVGTLKGTLYAMLFAVPIALLGAIYTSQFLRPALRAYIKPAVEIMASLPSVVLGFLAALWLAPIVSNAVPAVLTAIFAICLSAVIVGNVYPALPRSVRRLLPSGYEFAVLVPLLLFAGWAGWQMGNLWEAMFIGDFRLWYPQAFGLSFEQRNAFVVGFAMGFAIIPIIFTLSDDAMTNVPDAFRSGSLALGASRWQTAIRIVIPTASPGIFSALMIGLGRAVGETMIVVMATGNSPVTEWNPFSGMRTLSANIAVELPEAPYLGTLYRTLFLSAMVLFLMTFLVNTLAEILRQRLRERYRAVE